MLKKIAVNLMHRLGYDVYRIPKIDWAGLDRLGIKTVLNIGANRGQFAGKIRSVMPDASLFCFEPVKPAFEELERWAGSQQGMVRAFNIALGDRRGEAAMFLHTEHNDSSSMLPSTDSYQKTFPFVAEQQQVMV